jgi:hypothetical protein
MTKPTDQLDEAARGRIALWLDPADLEWLSVTCRCRETADEAEIERCARIRFRARAALHKAGLKD